MMALIANHLWQSTLVAGFAGLFTLAFRRHRAQVRHGIWLAASLKFLVPFALLVGAGSQVGWRASQSTAPTPIAQVVEVVIVGFTAPSTLGNREIRGLAGSATGESATTSALIAAWLAGVSVVLIVWFLRWRRVAALVKAGNRVVSGPVFESLGRLEARVPGARPLPLVVSRSSFEPGVFGIVRPVLLWPDGIEARLTGEQVDAILAHEVIHVRRHDNLVAALHMLVQTACWFHPLVWWIGSRLLDERERACDEAVVAMGSDPRIYAESILRTCEWYVEAPLVCVAGVTGSNLKRRVEQIMTADGRAALTAWTRSLLALALLAGVGLPIAVGVLTPRLRAQTPERFQREVQQRVDDLRTDVDRRVVGLHRAAIAVRVEQASPSPQPAAKAAFDVTSVKPNASGDGRVLIRPQPGGRLNLVNVPLRLMIGFAYQVQDFQIVAGPDWLGTARFDVVGKAETGNPSQDELRLMLRSLLADRFKLVVRPDKREMPTYSLVPARADGNPGAQLRRSDANCSAPASAPSAPLATGQIPPCGSLVGFGNLKARGTTLTALAAGLSIFAGRIVVDRTGLAGGYDVDLNWTPDQIPRPAGGGDQPVQVNGVTVDPNGPSLFTALQEQLGLKLESSKGPVDVLVVEHAEKPAED